MKDVLVTVPFDAKLITQLRAISDQLSIEQHDFREGWPDDYSTTAEIIYAGGAVPKPSQAPDLRWMQTHWAGVDHLRSSAIWQTDVTITTASGIHAPNIGQYTMAQLLVWANRIPAWLDHQRRKEWPTNDRWDTFVPRELRDQTVGILGYGSIGREIGRLAKAFGMQVLVTKRNARQLRDEGYTVPGTGDPEGTKADRIYPTEATRSMVAECDFVIATLPLTSQTRGLVDADMFAAMKETAYFVNVGRGELVDQEALITALEKGQIAGAGLDVFAEEPLPKDSPLWELDNVIISPHVSGFTHHYDRRAINLFSENLRRYLNGQPLLNKVDRDAGY